MYRISCESGGLAQPKEPMVAIAMGDREPRKQLSETTSKKDKSGNIQNYFLSYLMARVF